MADTKVITIPDYRAAKLGQKFREMVKRRQHLKKIIDKAEEELVDTNNPALNAEIELMLAERDLRSVVVDGEQVTVAEGSNTSLSKELLLEEGVPAETIEACTVSKKYTYIVVTKVKENKKKAEKLERAGIPIVAKGPGLKKSVRNRSLKKAAQIEKPRKLAKVRRIA